MKHAHSESSCVCALYLLVFELFRAQNKPNRCVVSCQSERELHGWLMECLQFSTTIRVQTALPFITCTPRLAHCRIHVRPMSVLTTFKNYYAITLHSRNAPQSKALNQLCLFLLFSSEIGGVELFMTVCAKPMAPLGKKLQNIGYTKHILIMHSNVMQS